MPIGRKRARRSEVSSCKRGRAADAEAEYKAALLLQPTIAPAAANLADLYRGLGREADGENVLRVALVDLRKMRDCITC